MTRSLLDEETSDLTKLINKVNIIFPRKINLEQARSLINYISEKLCAQIDYHYSGLITVGNNSVRQNTSSEQILSLEINGKISLLPRYPIPNSFYFRPSNHGISGFSAISFSLSGGDRISDYNPEVVQLWDDTRKVVIDYFEENPK